MGSFIFFVKNEHVSEENPVVVDNVDVESKNGIGEVVEVDILVVCTQFKIRFDFEDVRGLIVHSPSKNIESDCGKNEENDEKHTKETLKEGNQLEEDVDCEPDLFESGEIHNESKELAHTAATPDFDHLGWDISVLFIPVEEDCHDKDTQRGSDFCPHEVILVF